MKIRKETIIVLIIILIASVWIGSLVYRFRFISMDTDEAVHANKGLEIIAHLLSKQWNEIIADLIKPQWYPPMHGVITSLWMTIFNPSIVMIRLYSTFSFLVLGIVLYIISKDLINQPLHYICLIAPLFLIADERHVILGALSMLEIPSTVFLVVGLFYLSRYGKLEKSKYIYTALLFALICFFYRYNYGLAFLGIFFSYQIILFFVFPKNQKSIINRKSLIRNFLISFVIVSVVLYTWFILFEQWDWFIDYTGAQPPTHSFWSFENFSYYPRRLFDQFSNGIAVIFTCAGLIINRKNWNYLLPIFPFLLYFVLSIVMLTIEGANGYRFSMMLFSPIWVMGGLGARSFLPILKKRSTEMVFASIVILTVTFTALINLYNLPGNLLKAYENTNDGVYNAYSFISSTIDLTDLDGVNIVMIGRTDQWNGPALQFFLQSNCLLNDKSCSIEVIDTREIRFGWPERGFSQETVDKREADAMKNADYRIDFLNQSSQPDQWQLFDEQSFIFERRKKVAEIWVSIYMPADD